jgi:predicted Zn finger-like uncharacterized protein
MPDRLESSRERPSPATCPACASTRVAAASLAERFVYLRCSDCGEVWSIAERRAIPRTTVSPGPR